MVHCSECPKGSAFTVKERASGKLLHLCVTHLVRLCLAGALMHPNPRYEYVWGDAKP